MFRFVNSYKVKSVLHEFLNNLQPYSHSALTKILAFTPFVFEFIVKIYSKSIRKRQDLYIITYSFILSAVHLWCSVCSRYLRAMHFARLLWKCWNVLKTERQITCFVEKYRGIRNVYFIANTVRIDKADASANLSLHKASGIALCAEINTREFKYLQIY